MLPARLAVLLCCSVVSGAANQVTYLVSGRCGAGRGGSGISSKYYKPHGKGNPEEFGKSPYSGTFAGPPCNLSASFRWSWHHPDGRYNTMVMGGPVIDDKRDLYLTTAHGIYKFNPDGKVLWTWIANPLAPHFYLMDTPALLDGCLYTLSTDAKVHALDMETGQLVWQVQLATSFGAQGDNGFIVARDGRIIFDADRDEARTAHRGFPNRVFCLNATDGTFLWDFGLEPGVWNFIALFAAAGQAVDDTIVFQNNAGGVYRLNVTTGAQIWRSGPTRAQWTDGGHAVGENGVLYAVTAKGNQLQAATSWGGGLHAYRISDGQLLWENTDLEMGIFTWPVVGKLSKDAPLSVVTGVGSLASFPLQPALETFGLRWALGGAAFGLCLGALVLFVNAYCKKKRKYQTRRAKVWRLFASTAWGALASFAIALCLLYVHMKSEYPYSIQAFDADTGKLQWRVDLPTWRWFSAAGDEAGYQTRKRVMPWRPIALPCASSYPTIDAQGVVYLAHLDGSIYSIKDWDRNGVIDKDTELCRFHAGSSGFTAGPSIAPGMLAVSTTDGMYVFGQ